MDTFLQGVLFLFFGFMGFFVCKSEVEVKIIPILIFWGIRWLYKQLTASDSLTSNEELEEDDDYDYEDDEDDEEDEVEDKATSSITTIPITRKVARKAPRVAPFPKVIAANPRPPQLASNVIEKRKASLGNKRKLFRNILLVDALMQRKDLIT